MLQQLFFGYYAFTIIVLSLLVVTRRNPVHSVMWMLLLFFLFALIAYVIVKGMEAKKAKT